MKPNSTARARRRARCRSAADRLRDRCRQQRGAAARGVLSLCAPADERLRWKLDPQDDGGCSEISRVPGLVGRARRGESVSNRDAVPKAIGAVTYLDPALVKAECDEFATTLNEARAASRNPS